MVRFILLFGFIGWMIPGLAQTLPGPLLRHFTATDYRAENQNWSLTIDSTGYVYAGNNGALLEYDGLSWHQYHLPNRQIVRSVAAHDDRIYVGGYGEFGYFQRAGRGPLTYHSFSQGQLSPQDQREEIWHILPTDQGVFFQSFSRLFLWDGTSLQKLDIPGNIMYLQQVGDQLLLPVIGLGIYRWGKDRTFSRIPGSEQFSEQIISCLLPARNGFLVGTQNAGVFEYNQGRFRVWNTPVNAKLQKYQLNKGIRLRDGRYAWGTILAGVYLTDENGKTSYNLRQENGLQNNTVLSIMEDQQGNIWLGLDRGIDLLGLSHPLQFYVDQDGKIGSVYDASVFKGRLYLATNRGVFYRNWPLREEDPFQLIDDTRGQSWTFHIGNDQLLCGHNNGTYRINENQATLISPITGGWYFRSQEESPDILLQGCYTGIVRFDWSGEKEEWELNSRIQGVTHRVRRIVPDPVSEDYWVQSQHEGIFRIQLDLESNKVQRSIPYDSEKGIDYDVQSYLMQQGDRILLQSKGVTYVYNRIKDHFEPQENPAYATLPFRKKLTLPGKTNLSVFSDHVRFQQGNGPLYTFPVRLVPQFEGVRMLPDSSWLFCLDNGFALLPKQQTIQPVPSRAPLVKEVHFTDKKGTSTFMEQRQELQVPSGYKNALVDFGLPQYTQPVQLRYQLHPLQTDWSSWQTIAQKSFTNLSPGNYELRIQSNINPLVTRLPFSLEPHWYQTSWILVPYLLLISGILFGLYRWHESRLETEQRRLVLEKERQLQRERMENRNRELQQDIISKSKELANSTFSLIRKNELLIDIREQLDRWKGNGEPTEQEKHYRKIMRLINRQLSHEDDWEVFEQNFNQVHEAFFQKLIAQFPNLTPGELKLAACLKMNLSSKEIAPLLNISLRGVENKRYRLRKKLDLPNDENLTEFMLNL